MPRPIDADALMRQLEKKRSGPGKQRYTEGFNDALLRFRSMIHSTPTINAEPVRHGTWVDRYGNKYNNHLYECSECKGKARYRFKRHELGKEIAEQALDDYCPHCGAKMDGGVSDEG